MGSWTAIDWVITGVLLPLVGMIVWAIKLTLNYFLKEGGFLDDIRAAQKLWYAKHAEYMESSKQIQAATAQRLDSHDAVVVAQTQTACREIQSLSNTQAEHTTHLLKLVNAGSQACDAAIIVCEKLGLDHAGVEAVEKIKRELRTKVVRE